MQGLSEKRIGTCRGVYTWDAQQNNTDQSDNPWVYHSKVNCAINSWICKSGLSPCQFVFSKDQEIPTSPMNNEYRLAAQCRALQAPPARRTEQIRMSAMKAVLKLDADDKVRLALMLRSRPFRSSGRGTIVGVQSPLAAAQRVESQATICIMEGTSRGSGCRRPIFVMPKQLRDATQEELMAGGTFSPGLEIFTRASVMPARDQGVIDGGEWGSPAHDPGLRRPVGEIAAAPGPMLHLVRLVVPSGLC